MIENDHRLRILNNLATEKNTLSTINTNFIEKAKSVFK
jgi:hypothetical protein